MSDDKQDEQIAARFEDATTNMEKVETLQSATERAKLLLETAVVFDHDLEDTASAFSLALRSFWENPTRKETVAELERLADLTQRWEEVYATATDALEKTMGKTGQILLLFQIGKWYATKPDQLDLAFDCYTRVLEIDPTNVDAYKSIVHIYRASKQWEDLVTALETAASNCKDPAVARQFLFIRGSVLEQDVGDIDRASAAYESACEIDPGYVEALDALDRIYSSGEKWWKLLTVINRKAEVAPSISAKLELHLRQAGLHIGEAGDLEAAIEAYNQVLAIEPGHLEALDALEVNYRAAGQLNKVRDMLDRQIEATQDDGQRLILLARLATMLEDPLWEPDRAVASWEKVLEAAPDDPAALDALIRIHRRRRRFEELASALRRAIESRFKETSVVDMQLELGTLVADKLGRPSEAAELFCKILETEPEHIEALYGLAGAQEQQERWKDAETTLEIVLALTNDGLVLDERTLEETNFKLGSLFEAANEDPRRAVEHFTQVTEMNPEHRGALRGLRKIYLANDSLSDGFEVLKQEYELENSGREKADLAATLGLVSRGLEKEKSAREWFEQALRIDRFNEKAAREMVAIHLDEESFDKVVPLLEMLVRTEVARDKVEQRNFLVDLARAYRALGRTDKALETAQEAQKAAPADAESLRTLCDTLFEAERWEDALSAHHRLWDKEQAGAGGKEGGAQILYRLAVILDKLDKRSRAKDSLIKALATYPEHRPSLELIVDIYREEKKMGEVISHLKRLGHIAEDSERFEIMKEIGDLASNQIDDHEEAIAAYEEAVQIKHDDHATMTKLLPLYQATEKWPQVVDTIRRIIETETDPHRSARFYNSMGIVYREKLDNHERAADCFNDALDFDPGDREVFATLVELLGDREDWEGLFEAYQKMITRIEGKGEKGREVELWHSLGLVYLKRTENFEKAAEAFEKAYAINPHDTARVELLASCYVHSPGRVEDAIGKYRELVARDPENAVHLRLLGDLLAKEDRLDELWNVSGALVAIGKAHPSARQFYASRRPSVPEVPEIRLTGALWTDLIAHRDDDPVLAELFELVTPAISSRMEKPLKSYGLRKRDKVSKKKDSPAVRIYYRLGELMSLDGTPDLYVKQGDSHSFSYTVTEPPISMVGERYLEMHSLRELLFVQVKHLAYQRPGYRIRWIIPSIRQLQVLLAAALKLGVPTCQPPLNSNEVFEGMVENLRQLLDSARLEALHRVAEELVARPDYPSIVRWIAGIEYTACRAALVYCGDLAATVQLIKTHNFGQGGPSARAQIADLIAYGVSGNYATLRSRLG